MPAAETPETHRSGAVSITALARLTRVENALFIATATLFPGIMESTLTEHSFLFAAGFIAVFAAAAGSFALNDYTDRRADRRNMRLDRPLVTGDAESTTALRAAAFLFTAALVPAAVLPGPAAAFLAGIMLLDPLPAVWSVDRRILQDPSPATVIRARRWFIRAMMAGSSAYLLGTLL
jgi:4-hydroxybenzoate polyprenyltransferase